MYLCNHLVQTEPAAESGITCLLCQQQLTCWPKTALATGKLCRYCWRTQGQTAASGDIQKTQQQKRQTGVMHKSLSFTACSRLGLLEWKCHHICQCSGAIPACADQAVRQTQLIVSQTKAISWNALHAARYIWFRSPYAYPRRYNYFGSVMIYLAPEQLSIEPEALNAASLESHPD